jgi:tRNA threonylcarbamoyladenosine biosynthesis protein TsaE
MAAGIEPRAKPRFVGGKFGIGDAELGKPELLAPDYDVACKLREVQSEIACRGANGPARVFKKMMPIIEELRIFLPDAEATAHAGARLAPGVTGGMLVTLSGELGAGKTTLVRGMLRRLGWAGTVKSPTYTLLEHYFVSSLYFYHFDLYRFSEPEEWDRAGFSEYLRPDTVCVLEWPERAAGWLPAGDIEMRFEHADTARVLTLGATTVAGSACLAAFAANP